jgi:DnaJ-class molecular chaperone
MSDKQEPEKTEKITCPSCGGSGQLGSFGGVSRFVISWDECEECCGTGFVLQAQKSREDNNPPDITND